MAVTMADEMVDLMEHHLAAMKVDHWVVWLVVVKAGKTETTKVAKWVVVMEGMSADHSAE